jgi:hypothetical protein
MKWSTRILLMMLVVVVAGLLVSNIVMKKEYEKIDKNDIYWTYGKVLDQHFKYLKIEGGNTTKIAFEQSPNCSVRVLHDWQRVRENPVKTFVSNDTLFIKFTYISTDEGEINWMKRLTLVRVFSPELLSVDGFNTNFEMFKIKQKNFTVNMSGKSTFEVESFIPNLDTLNISQKDSSEVVFEMSPEYKLPETNAAIKVNGSEIKSTEAMTIQYLNASVQGNSLLDIGHAQINSMKLNIADSSGIILSGAALKKLPK